MADMQAVSEDVRIPDRAELRADLEALRVRVHDLLRSLSTEDWRRKGQGSVWAVRELLAHCLGSIQAIPTELASIRRGRNLLNLPPRLFNPVRITLGRVAGRLVSPKTIASKFDAAIDAALVALETVRDDEWHKGAHFYGEGYWTVETVFRMQPRHFDEHAATIREIVRSGSGRIA